MNSEIKSLEEKRERLIAEESKLIEEIYDIGNYHDAEELERQIENHTSSSEYRLEEIGKQIAKLDEKIGSHKRIEFLTKNISSINRNANKTLNEDYLNRTELAKIIVDLIKKQDKSDNFSIGILGEWGSGKSTFLKFIQKQLKDDSNVILFNASTYDDQEQIWYSLLSSISEKYLSNKKIKFKKIKYIYKSILLKKDTELIWGSIVAPVLFILSTTLFAEYIKDSNVYSGILGVSTGLISIITGFISYDFLRKLYNKFANHFNNSKEKFLKELKYPEYKKFLGNRENIRHDLIVFKELLINQIEKENTSGNLIIIIDELDRCADSTIINFFTAIEAYIDIPGITFIFSINPEVVYPVVAEAIPNRELNQTETGGSNQNRLGARFIEKYIKLFVTLPINSDYSSYVKEILKDIIEDDTVEKLINFINGISSNKKITPRELKKLLDLIIIYKEDFLDLTFLEFSVLLFMKYYYGGFVTVFEDIHPRSNLPIKSLESSKIKIENSDIPRDILQNMITYLADSNMNCISKSMPKIERILIFT